MIIGPVFADANPGYSGTGYLDFHHDFDKLEPTFMSFDLDWCEAGDFILSFRYVGLHDSSFTVITGSDEAPILVELPATDAHNTWEVVEVNITREESGPVSLKLFQHSNLSADIDCLNISRVKPLPLEASSEQ